MDRKGTSQPEEQIVAGLNTLFQHIDHDGQYADQELAKFPADEERYHAITSVTAALAM